MLGPAVLFWGVVVIAIAAGFILGRVTLTPLRNWEWILLGLGLTQGHVLLPLLVVGWLLALGWRRKLTDETRADVFNLTQVGVGVLTLLALGALCWAVHFGLLGYPDMQISGNGSSSHMLRWLTWGWQSFSTAGLWRQRLRKGSFRFLSAEGREIKEDDTPSK